MPPGVDKVHRRWKLLASSASGTCAMGWVGTKRSAGCVEGVWFESEMQHKGSSNGSWESFFQKASFFRGPLVKAWCARLVGLVRSKLWEMVPRSVNTD